MKLSSYCFLDLKMIIFYRGHARLIFPALWSFGNFLTVSLICATPLAFFQWILMIASSYCSHDLKRIVLYLGDA